MFLAVGGFGGSSDSSSVHREVKLIRAATSLEQYFGPSLMPNMFRIKVATLH